MTCAHCGDLGMVIQEWDNAPHDFAVCVCPAGQAWRRDENEGRKVAPQWLVWCVRWQVEPSRVVMLEDVYTQAELTAAGLLAQASSVDREAALLAAGRKAKR